MKQVFITLMGLNLVALLLVILNYLKVNIPNTVLLQAECLTKETSESVPDNVTSQYKFDNPLIAYHLLQKLDIFENSEVELPPKKYVIYYYFGLVINDNYCDEHRAYFVNHPEYIFTQKNFLIDDWNSNSVRSAVVPSIGKDLHPDIGNSMPKSKRNSFTVKQRPDINIFYTYEGMWKYRVLGKQFSCLTQISNHCPGHQKLDLKDKSGEALVEYAKGYQSKPQCFSTEKFFPKTWVMMKSEQCQDFFEVFNSPEYLELKAERNIVYMRKVAGVHKGEGVFPVNDAEEQYIRTLYDNGKNCGNVTQNNIMQTFIHNPLLLQNRKFHFRVFLYVASANPFIVYYHDGYLRISFQEYDKNSQELGTFVTNLGMTEILFQDNNGLGGRTDAQLKEDSYWFYPQFHQYLMEQGLVTDPDWLDNYLRAEMKKAMVHLIRMAQDTYLKKSSLTELYGVDFMMDDNLNLWFIEANSGPLIQGWDPKTIDFFDKMLRESFEIAFGLLRSRTKRIINYINELTREKDAWALQKETLVLQNLKERREEFKKLSMNYFEPEFEPNQGHGFHQIIDENLTGTERYFGILEEECL